MTDSLTIAITGASGLIGRPLVARLRADGHTVIRLVRRQENLRDDEIHWNPMTTEIDFSSLDGVDAVINLAGEPIASGRWTDERKKLIMDSRVQGTALLAAVMNRSQRRPSVFVSPSAIGFYGDRGDEELTEFSMPGKGFLADVCIAWEQAVKAATDVGVRVVHPRIGVVLSRKGGALREMLPPFKLGLGGRLGSGQQWWSWIALDDMVQVLIECVTNEQLRGPVNAVAPNPVRNVDFTKTLGRVISRPTIFPVPPFALRILLGEMADALLLASIRVLPMQLQEAGFTFEHTELEAALRAELD